MKETLKKKHTLIVVCGPTAAGKTSIGLQLAKVLDTEIISADSRQFYKEIPIGTAQPSAVELNKIKHHFISDRSVTISLNAGEFEKEALVLIDNLFKKHSSLLLVGGSGLYIDAVCEGFHDLPVADLEIRDNLQNIFLTEGVEGLSQILKKIDPIKYEKSDVRNPQRLMRAIEVIKSGGKSFDSQVSTKIKKRSFNILKIGITLPREILYKQINERVDLMIKSGLEKECKSNYQYQEITPLKTVGYSEFFSYFEGHISYAECLDKIKQNTRRYAKRQLTWFNRDKNIKWFAPNEIDLIKEYIFANKN